MADFLPGDILVGGAYGYAEHLRADGATFVQHLELPDEFGAIPTRVNGITFSPSGEAFFALGDPDGAADNDPHDVVYVPSVPPKLAALIAKSDDTANLITLDLLDGAVLTTYTGIDVDAGWTRDRYLKLDVGCDGRTVYYTDQGRTIFRFDLATGSQLTPFAQLAPDSPYVYAALKLRRDGDLIVAMTDSGNGPRNGIAFDKDNLHIWVDEINPDDESYEILKRLQTDGDGNIATHTVSLDPAAVNDEVTALGSYVTSCGSDPTVLVWIY